MSQNAVIEYRKLFSHRDVVPSTAHAEDDVCDMLNQDVRFEPAPCVSDTVQVCNEEGLPFDLVVA